MEIVSIAIVGLLIPLAFFFAGVGILIGVEWCLHRYQHFTIRDAIIAMTLVAALLIAGKLMLPK